jgi:hypothetical protein
MGVEGPRPHCMWELIFFCYVRLETWGVRSKIMPLTDVRLGGREHRVHTPGPTGEAQFHDMCLSHD